MLDKFGLDFAYIWEMIQEDLFAEFLILLRIVLEENSVLQKAKKKQKQMMWQMVTLLKKSVLQTV